jgi:hypothetical protein
MSIADDAADSGLWLSLSEIARRRGISKQAISKRLARLVARGAAVPTCRRGRLLLINIAAFDCALGEDSFLPQTQAAATARLLDEPLLLAPPKGGKSIIEVQREKLLYDTGLTALKYAEARGEVVPIAGDHGLEQAVREIGDAFRQAVGRLHLRAPAAVAVAGKDGVPGMRALLKAAERDILGSLANALSALGERGRAIEAAGGFAVELAEPEAKLEHSGAIMNGEGGT